MIVSKFVNSENTYKLPKPILDIINYVAAQNLEDIELGKYSVDGLAQEDAHFVVMEYQTQETSPVGAEFHKVYTDVQLIVSGAEQCGWAIITDKQVDELAAKYTYNSTRDICFIDETEVKMNYFTMQIGEFYVFTPNTLHMPNLNVDDISTVRKVVIKIRSSLFCE